MRWAFCDNSASRSGLRGTNCWLFSQVLLYRLELLQGRLQALYDLRGEHLWLRQVLRVLQAFVLEPEDIKAALIPLDQLIISEGMETIRFGPFPAVLRIVAADEVLEILVLKRISL